MSVPFGAPSKLLDRLSTLIHTIEADVTDGLIAASLEAEQALFESLVAAGLPVIEARPIAARLIMEIQE